VPPDRLWHGTSSGALNSIFASGINSGQRQHVHLSTDIDTARQVGRRHVRGNEQPVVLEVNARELHDRGQEFLLSANGVWLTKPIPLGAFKKID
jgi:putative RNA 2'-phosphotransferase